MTKQEKITDYHENRGWVGKHADHKVNMNETRPATSDATKWLSGSQQRAGCKHGEPKRTWRLP